MWNCFFKKSRISKDLLKLHKAINTNSSFCQKSRKYLHTSKILSQEIDLTRNRFTVGERGAFSYISNEDQAFFEKLLSPSQIVTDPQDLESYNIDWQRIYRGTSQLLLKPQTTEEVSAILKYCDEKNLAVCPQSGNTSLSGGSVPVFDEIIISTTLLNKIINFDDLSGILVCESGCILETLEKFVDEKKRLIPLDLGAKGSCYIGGNVATNAGGLRFLRYGSLRGNVLGLEVVLANGEILDCLSTMKKDNTGYDLKQLFIGSEGTLGIITKVSIMCPPRPTTSSLAILGCENFQDVLWTFRSASSYFGNTLSAVEFMDKDCVFLVGKHLNINCPLQNHPHYLLLEISEFEDEIKEAKVENFLEEVLGKGKVSDGIFVKEPSKMQLLWSIRENISTALKKEGHVFKYDVSVPLPVFYETVEIMKKRLGSNVWCVGYGHLGDSNLHLNIVSSQYTKELDEKIEPFIFDQVKKHRGSISAEHGLGFRKKDFIYHSKSAKAVSLMKDIKHLLDPKGILNPYKVLPNQ